MKRISLIWCNLIENFCDLFIRVFHIKNSRKKIVGKPIMDNESASNYIKKAIDKNEPCMICRFGTSEINAVNNYLFRSMKLKKNYKESVRKAMINNAGFFPDEESFLDKFGEEMLVASKNADLIGVWNKNERFVLKNYVKKASFCRLGGLYAKSALPNQWTQCLAGKKVLIIHPFEDSIRKQYENKEKVFPNGFLPDFELKTLKAVQTIAGEKDQRFSNWFEALEYMENEISKIDYEVAIIGCGAYGFLLASYVKKMGKIALHLGGGTQLMFGIMGKRWEDSKKHAINEYWVHPTDDETPEAAKKVEGGCYW